jgi:hypothetical protein
MSPQYVTTERFDDHLVQSEKQYKSTSDTLADIQKELGTKVSWLVFWSIFVLLVGVVVTTFGVLYNAVNETKSEVQSQGKDVSYIRGVLDKAEITQ